MKCYAGCRGECRCYSGMEPRPEGTYAHHVFRDHNCGGCDSGAKTCLEGNYGNCSNPRARND